MMKFDGNLWKWLIENVMTKLLPSATAADAGKVAKVQNDGTVAWGEDAAMPSGGTAGQVLTRTEQGSDWQDVPSELPSGGTEGQVLTKGASGNEWANVPSELPEGGSNGQVLTKNSNGVGWANVPTELPAGSANNKGLILVSGGYSCSWGSMVPTQDVGTLTNVSESGGTVLFDTAPTALVNLFNNFLKNGRLFAVSGAFKYTPSGLSEQTINFYNAVPISYSYDSTSASFSFLVVGTYNNTTKLMRFTISVRVSDNEYKYFGSVAVLN